MLTKRWRDETLLNYRILDYVWLVLMAMTILSAVLAESADPSLLITVVVATTIALKGRMVLDRFMELRNANVYIRFAMNLYFYVLPAMIVLVFLFPDLLAKITTLPKP